MIGIQPILLVISFTYFKDKIRTILFCSLFSYFFVGGGGGWGGGGIFFYPNFLYHQKLYVASTSSVCGAVHEFFFMVFESL